MWNRFFFLQISHYSLWGLVDFLMGFNSPYIHWCPILFETLQTIAGSICVPHPALIGWGKVYSSRLDFKKKESREKICEYILEKDERRQGGYLMSRESAVAGRTWQTSWRSAFSPYVACQSIKFRPVAHPPRRKTFTTELLWTSRALARTCTHTHIFRHTHLMHGKPNTQERRDLQLKCC